MNLDKANEMKRLTNALHTTSGLAQGGVFARRKSCRTFKRSLPREHL